MSVNDEKVNPFICVTCGAQINPLGFNQGTRRISTYEVACSFQCYKDYMEKLNENKKN